MSEHFLPYGRQWVRDEDVEAVSSALLSDWLTTGPWVEKFERALAAGSRARWAVATSSGTAALHAAYFAAGLGPGDEIVTTPLTFAGTANAALHLGAGVRFADVDPETGTLDPAGLEEAITPQTRLIVPIDYAGHPADYDPIREIAERRGLTVVADAAHSLGATYHGRPVGTLAELSITSFHPVKPITTAEGGAVLTDDEELARRARRFVHQGIERDPERMQEVEGPWSYEVQDLGLNYRLSDLHAALGASQLERLGEYLGLRSEIARRYDEGLGDLPQVILPVERPEVRSGWHLYVLRVAGDPGLRRPFFERLRELGLGVQVHYIPVHHHPLYRRLGYAPELCPRAVDFYRRAVSLPIYPRMNDADVDSAIERVRQAVGEIL